MAFAIDQEHSSFLAPFKSSTNSCFPMTRWMDLEDSAKAKTDHLHFGLVQIHPQNYPLNCLHLTKSDLVRHHQGCSAVQRSF